jgi:hypothetical protein
VVVVGLFVVVVGLFVVVVGLFVIVVGLFVIVLGTFTGRFWFELLDSHPSGCASLFWSAAKHSMLDEVNCLRRLSFNFSE